MTDEPYSWTILRVVPRVERGERLNVGVALLSRRHRYLHLDYELDAARLRALDPAIDVDAIGAHLAGLQRVAAGDPTAGRIAGMELPDRFGFIAAPSSTIIQPAPVHTGLCADPADTLAGLMARYVRL